MLFTVNINIRVSSLPSSSDLHAKAYPTASFFERRIAGFGNVSKRQGIGETATWAYAAEVAAAAGADAVGFEDLAERMQGGEIDFDVVIATPDAMRVVGKLGQVLGPRGLMPNPKLGSVTNDIRAAVEAAKSGEVQYRVEKLGIVHAGIGKASFSEDQIRENLDAFLDAVVKAKPSGVKGTYINKLALTSTMGPGVRFDMNDLTGSAHDAAE